MMIPLYMGAQKTSPFTVEVSSDTVGLDGYIQVTFTVKNEKSKKFTPPEFEGFEAQGPSTSSMMSMVNGETTQSMSYTYTLLPKEKGVFTIGKATLKTDNETFQTDEKKIVVVEHFEGETNKPNRRRNFFDDDDFFQQRSRPVKPQPQREQDKSKSKYPTEKI